jgi:hypothetical protein
MCGYRVSFFKTLLSSDGHRFKCLQQTIDIGSAEDVDRAVEAAKRAYELVRHVADWTLQADAFEVETMAPVLAAVSIAPRG